MAKKKKSRVWLVIVILLVLLAAGAFVYFRVIAPRAAMAAQPATPELTYAVERGTVSTTITAAGQLEATGKATQQLPDGLLVTGVDVKAGDAVTVGQKLASLDRDSVYTQLLYVDSALKKLDKKLGKDEFSKRIDAPTEGRLKYQPVKIGDNVTDAMNEYGVLAILSVDGLMELSIETDAALTIGERYVVKFDGVRVWGNVVSKTDGGYTLTLPDERAPYLGNADVYDGETLVGSGVLQIHAPVSVVGYAGVIERIGYELDQSVPGGKIMFAIKNAPSERAWQQKYIERDVVAKRLEALIRLYADPTVYATFDGVISEAVLAQDVYSGKVEKCDKNSDAFKYSVEGATILAATVDELDIGKVVLGQTADITFIAHEGETFSGVVTRIGLIGKKENSISTYRIEITVPQDGRLLEGMNGTASILAEQAENVLLIPAAAINEDVDGSYVDVLAADGTKQRVLITTGLSDGTNVEVLSGLNEGDTIVYADMSGNDAMYDMATSVAVG